MIISNFIQSLIAVAMALGSDATPLDVRSPQDPGTLFNGTLFVCAFPNYVLPCANFNYSTDVCVNLTVPFMNSTASATPRDTFSICALFTGPNCTGSSITVSYPGNSNINPPTYASFRCTIPV
ncbi:hypothetical protein JR316_0005533 [Psilocybe cubensis]|uniref:Uncharacterized protein n=1 Tax=Psilocybe cubensis TaxID=181762 RepID=A0ACB8GZ37_PSICU|nr:hypothetical protein JR316_0005533 [Psilocybe cubensis]KAH9481015.1 hypothetical protein JR316_0005533 [Psilocybe cubensis]